MKRMMPAMLLSVMLLTGCYDGEYCEYPETPAMNAIQTVPESTEVKSTNVPMFLLDQTTPAAEQADPPERPDEPVQSELFTEITTEETTTEPETTAKAAMTEPSDLAETAPAETEQITETEMTEPETEPTEETTAESVQSDYDKALEVYEYMLENGHGTCVNYACQTFEKCQEIGLPCYIVWTDAQLYGHVANTVQVDGIWFILDTQGQKFLTYNSGFTEVIDMEMHHIGGAEMLSNYRYDEMFGEKN